MTVYPFRSAAQRRVEENFCDFVEGARAANPWSIPDWNASKWPFPKRKRASSTGKDHLLFNRHPDEAGAEAPLEGAFADFVKAACVRYELKRSQGYSVATHQGLIRAARYLEQALSRRSVEITAATGGDFDTALHLCMQREMPNSISKVSQDLVRFAEMIDRHHLAPTPLRWKRRVAQPHIPTVGAAAAERRRNMMPSDEVLDAVAQLSRASNLDPRDLVRQRAIDLLACGGFRMNEVLTLPRDCLVEEPVIGEGGAQKTDRFGEPLFRLGIRYWPEKGGHTETLLKVVPTVMIDIARRAIADILAITEPFARIAKFAHENPGRTRFGEPWDSMGSEELISIPDAAKLLGLWGTNPYELQQSGQQYLKRNNIERHDRMVTIVEPRRTYQRRGRAVRKGDVEAHVAGMSRLGNVLGDVAVQQVHESLFVVPLRYFRFAMDAGMNGTAMLMDEQQLNTYVSGTDTREDKTKSIFERRDMKGRDSEFLKVTSHQFRHWLDTLAIEGGASDHERARWMGRKNIKQNPAYDHSQPRIRAERVQEALRNGEVAGPVGEAAIKINDPVRREEFVQSVAATVHVTDIGFCTNDWSALPCPDFGACETCVKALIVKGDAKARERTSWQLDKVKVSIEIAAAEDADGTIGANNWLNSHLARRESLERILAIHDDPEIPDGSFVQLNESGWRILGEEEMPDAA